MRALRWVPLMALALLAGCDTAEEATTVGMGDNFFEPEELTVAAGEAIVFDNFGQVPHNAIDVHRSGTGTTPDEHTDQVTLAQGDRAVLEFRLPTRGRYMFHPHQHHMAERGAMGWFTAV